MTVPLPQAFVHRMQALLPPEEAQAFLRALRGRPYVGLRVNTLKIAVEDFLRLAPWPLTPVPWCPEGFVLEDPAARPGTHPYHAAGLFYIQDPTAMAPAALLDPQPGEWVLDLAAAPGGKTTHLAARMQDRGLLVANDVQPRRLRELNHNLDRWAATQVLVTQALPGRLARAWGAIFHRVLVDAPCSGEGMFRKDPQARRTWSPNLVARCARMQTGILKAAARLVRPGGFLLYSTCTFAVEENEGVLARFLEEHPDFTLVPLPEHPGFDHGHPEWLRPSGPEALRHAVRLWPHRVPGEGHFLALLRREPGVVEAPSPGRLPEAPARARRLYQAFVEATLTRDPAAGRRLYLQGNRLYALPQDLPPTTGISIARWGLPLGQVKKDRFEPEHALALTLRRGDAQRVLDFPPEDPRLRRFFAGEGWPDPGPEGWVLITVQGYGLGWARRVQGRIKPRIPAWLHRWSGT